MLLGDDIGYGTNDDQRTRGHNRFEPTVGSEVAEMAQSPHTDLDRRHLYQPTRLGRERRAGPLHGYYFFLGRTLS